MPTAPNAVKQRSGGYCFAACLQSLDNKWGGSYTQYDSGIGSNGYVNTNNSIVGWTAGTSTYADVKAKIDGGSYCLVYMVGTYSHWVVAYAASVASSAGISVMDPYNGNFITLQAAMNIEGASSITENRVAYKKV